LALKAEARNAVGLKTITAKHLGLASEVPSFVVLVLRRFFCLLK
jgi:hypothetical protein